MKLTRKGLSAFGELWDEKEAPNQNDYCYKTKASQKTMKETQTEGPVETSKYCHLLSNSM